MAKLGKTKIMLSGDVISHTTSPGDIEVYMYYSVDKDHFYFEKEELSKYIPNCEIGEYEFRGCKTKEQAIAIVKAYVGDVSEKKRYLRINLSIEAVMDKSKEELSKQLQEMCTWSGANYRNITSAENKKIRGESKRNIGVSIERVLKVSVGEEFVYLSCGADWELRAGKYAGTHSHNLIEWTQEIEDFIINMQSTMDKMCKQIVDFFNVESKEELQLNVTSVKQNLLS